MGYWVKMSSLPRRFGRRPPRPRMGAPPRAGAWVMFCHRIDNRDTSTPLQLSASMSRISTVVFKSYCSAIVWCCRTASWLMMASYHIIGSTNRLICSTSSYAWAEHGLMSIHDDMRRWPYSHSSIDVPSSERWDGFTPQRDRSSCGCNRRGCGESHMVSHT
jgi:hypothetical protein